MTDCLLIVLDDLREYGKSIPIYDADRREAWVDATAEAIVRLTRGDQRMAWVALVANDLCLRVPGLPLSVAAGPLLDRVRAMDVSKSCQ